MRKIETVGFIETQINLNREPLRCYVSMTVSGHFVYGNQPYVQGLEYRQDIFWTMYYPRQVTIYGIDTF